MIPIWPYGVHENCPIFETLNLLFIYVQNFSPPWPWMFSFKQTSPVQTITNELKQNMIEGRNTNNNMLNTINKVSTELFIIIIHWEDVGKLLLWKYWKIIKKTSLVMFLLNNLSCPIHLPITIPKTSSTASVSFACPESFQNFRENVRGGIIL